MKAESEVEGFSGFLSWVQASRLGSLTTILFRLDKSKCRSAHDGRRRHAQQRRLSVDASLRAHLDTYAKRGHTPQTSRSMVTMWSLEFANHKQSLVLSSGGGENRKHQISSRIRQLRVITGNRILSQRNQNTRKSTFGKTLCQLAKSEPRRRREGRTWETCPPPRRSANWPVAFCRARVMKPRGSWRVPCCGYWHFRKRNRDPLPIFVLWLAICKCPFGGRP